MSDPRRAYDPIPDLAQLLAGLHAFPAEQFRADRRAALAGLLNGPVDRLVRGLRLADPAVLARGTEAAIRAALNAAQAARIVTKSGKLITAEEIEGWVAEAERGYDPAGFTVPPGHIRAGHTADGPADCERCQLIRDNAHWLALPGTEDPEGS